MGRSECTVSRKKGTSKGNHLESSACLFKHESFGEEEKLIDLYYNSMSACSLPHSSISSLNNSTPHTGKPKRKRQCLNHLTQEEKTLRRKLKNRVAAQSARDRKKAIFDQMKDRMAKLAQESIKLMSLNSILKEENERLTVENSFLKNILCKNKIQLVSDVDENINPQMFANLRQRTGSIDSACGYPRGMDNDAPDASCEGWPNEFDTNDEKSEKLLNSLLTSYPPGYSLSSTNEYSSLMAKSSKQLVPSKNFLASSAFQNINCPKNSQQQQVDPLAVLGNLYHELSSNRQQKISHFTSLSEESNVASTFPPARSNFFVGEEVYLGDVLNSGTSSGEIVHDEIAMFSLSSSSCSSSSGQSNQDSPNSGYNATPVFSSNLALANDVNQSTNVLNAMDSVTELFPDLI